MEKRPRIVDFSTHLAGPMASHLLAELGADVIKVERPEIGDGNRGLEPMIQGKGMLHWALNSGTRSLVADARSDHWPSIVAACARWADAVIVGLRPIDAARRGLDFASLRRSNPNIVYCLISGYGEEGPWKDNRAHGQTLDAFAGLVPVEWRGGMPRTPAGWRSTGTTLGGVFGALGVMAGIHRRDVGGGAQHVSVSIWASALWWSWRDATCLLNNGEPWSEYREMGTRYSMYPTSDDRALIIAPTEKIAWTEFCNALALPEPWKTHGSWEASGMDHGDGPEYEHERKIIADTMRRSTFKFWIEVLQKAGIPYAPVLSIEEALASAHAASQGVVRSTMGTEENVRLMTSPLRIPDHAATQVGVSNPEPDSARA